MNKFKLSSMLSRLSFSPEVEKKFLVDYDDRFYTVNRMSLIIGLLVMALFGLLDSYSTPNEYVLRIILVVRYLIICPIFIAGILWSFLPSYRKYMQTVTSVVSGLGGLGIAFMVGLSNHGTAAFNSYYVGMILMTLALYTFARVQFKKALVVSLAIMLSYEIAAVFFQQLLSAPMGYSTFITANFFFITANLVGAFASYSLEVYTRQDFIQRLTIEDERVRSEILLQQEAASALLASEERFRTLIEISAEGVAIINQQGKFLYVSPAYERLLGYTANSLVDTDFQLLIHPDDLPSVLGTFTEFYKTPDQAISVEYRTRDIAGNWHIAYSTGKFLPDGNIVVYSRDITENKQAETSLIRKNEYLTTLHDTTLDLINRLETPGLLKTIVARAANLLDAQEAYIFLVEPDGSSLVAETGVGPIFTERGRFHVQRGEGVGGRVWASGGLFSVDDYQAWEHRMEVPAFKDFRAVVGAPLTSGEHVVGVLTLARTATNETFRSDQLDFLTQFSNLVSIALDNARLYTAAKTELAERRRTEEKLRQLNEELELRVEERTAEVKRLAAIIETTSDAVGIGDLQGNIVYLNRAGRQLFGVRETADVTQTSSFMDFYPDHVRPLIRDGIASIMQGELWSRELTIRGQQGESEIPVSQVSFALYDDNGQPEYATAIIRDISSQKQVEAELKAAKEAVEIALAESKRLAIIIESMPDYVGIADLQGNSLYINRAGRRLVGKPEKNDNIPWNVAKCYPSDSMQQLEPMFRAMQQGESWVGELDLQHADGHRIPTDHVVFPLHDANGQIESYAAVIRNITERKQAEEELRRAKESAEAANKAKSTFLANMSHEIRTPMNAVIGMTSLLLETPLNPKQQDFVETIRSSGDVLLTIINDILDFSKIEAGKMELVNRPLDLRSSIESILDLMAPRIAEKNLNVAYYMGENVPAAILGDSTRLRQILMNLVGNAVKFTEDGEIVIRVDAKRITEVQTDAPAKYKVYFTVRDTGIGIPPDKQDRLFTSFSQVDPSSTRVYGGTGLGLAISKRLAELMEGSMWVESTGIPGEGTIFHYTIRAEETELPAQRISHGSVAELRGKKVLLVDDHETNLQILQLQTEAWGMVTSAVNSSEQALVWLEQGQHFDIAILDSQMPGMNGVELAKAIRNRETGLGSEAMRMPIVLLTSVLQSESDASDLFDAILTKPVKSSNLFDALMTTFDLRQNDEPNSKRQPAYSSFDVVEHLADKYPLRILLVEDVLVNQKFAMLALERIGYRADVAGNGQEALDAILRQPYDVVLMDINMPVMDGYEASKKIHELWTDTSKFMSPRPWIIAMTANALQGDRELALNAGADDYISKPVYLNELQMVLARAGQMRRNQKGKVMKPDVEIRMDQNYLQSVLDLPDGKSLIAAYLEESPTMLSQIRDAIANLNPYGIRDAAHALKGSSLYVGAVDVADLAKELEMAGRNSTFENVETTLLALERAYDMTSSNLAKYM